MVLGTSLRWKLQMNLIPHTIPKIADMSTPQDLISERNWKNSPYYRKSQTHIILVPKPLSEPSFTYLALLAQALQVTAWDG